MTVMEETIPATKLEPLPVLEKDFTPPREGKALRLSEPLLKSYLKAKFITNKQYLFFALQLTYGDGARRADVLVDDFCEYWSINVADFNIYVAQLEKKGQIQSSGQRVIQLSLFGEPSEE